MATHVTRLILILSLGALWFFVKTGQSSACSCVKPGYPSEELAQSEAAFLGKVVDIREYNNPNITPISSTDPTTIKLEVHTVWKGHLYQTMYLTAERSEVSCGFTFMEGQQYMVYSQDGSTVSLCSRTAPLPYADADIDELGEGRTPQLGTSAPAPRQDTTPSGGCGLGSAAADAAWLGIMAGLVRLGVRRHPRQ